MYAGVVLPPRLLYSTDGIEYERWAKTLCRKCNMTTLKSVLDAYANLDLTSDIKNIKCPTMLLMGNDSALNNDDKLGSASYDGLIRIFWP